MDHRARGERPQLQRLRKRATVGAVQTIPGSRRRSATADVAAQAPATGTAGRAPAEHDAISRRERGDAAADLFDDARSFVAQQHRQTMRPAGLDQVQVAVADAARLDPDEDLVFARRVDLDLFEAEAPDLAQDDAAIHDSPPSKCIRSPGGHIIPRPMALLAIEDVTRRFGGIVALADVSLDLEEGQIVGLIGPNGAGKTTLFNLVTRLYRPHSGRILFEGKDLTRTPAYRIARLGIARTFQNVVLFQNMTVLENVLVGAHARLRPFSEHRSRKEAQHVLEYLELGELGRRLPGGLPFGTLKRVELARALAAKPTLLLLDEPAGGLNHEEVGELAELIRSLQRDLDLTILLVEHHMNLVMSVSDRVHVLNFGRKIAAGTPGEVQANPAVIEAYLGAEHVDAA